MKDEKAHEVPIDDTLDLHSFQPRDIPSVVQDYLEAAQEKGVREVRLIHGRGIGVQRAVVHRLLRSHPLVRDFNDAGESHLGATVVRLHDNRREAHQGAEEREQEPPEA
jgi:DNA-nicking Smr family endonuclease